MKCSVCGKELDNSDFEYLKKKGMCFECNLWKRRYEELQTLPEHKVAIIDNTYYFIGPEDSSDPFRGFGGRQFQIEFNDGYRVVTTNLWCGGDISTEYWRNKLPNNAKFENDLKWKKIGECNYLVENDSKRSDL